MLKKCFNIKITFLSILLITVFFQISPAQSNEEKILRGIDHVYHLRFDSAEVEFNQVIVNDPSSPAGYFFLRLVEN